MTAEFLKCWHCASNINFWNTFTVCWRLVGSETQKLFLSVPTLRLLLRSLSCSQGQDKFSEIFLVVIFLTRRFDLIFAVAINVMHALGPHKRWLFFARSLLVDILSAFETWGFFATVSRSNCDFQFVVAHLVVDLSFLSFQSLTTRWSKNVINVPCLYWPNLFISGKPRSTEVK